jgi:hypothetical protein
MARRDPVGIRLINRRGNDWTQRYPLVAEAVNHLKFLFKIFNSIENQRTTFADSYLFCNAFRTNCISTTSL